MKVALSVCSAKPMLALDGRASKNRTAATPFAATTNTWSGSTHIHGDEPVGVTRGTPRRFGIVAKTHRCDTGATTLRPPCLKQPSSDYESDAEFCAVITGAACAGASATCRHDARIHPPSSS